MSNYTQHYNKKKTPQTQPIPGKDMVKMRSGGYGFKVGDWQQLRRFMILGTVGGTYYASEKEMTIECAEVIERCLNEDYRRTIRTIHEVSVKGLALKNDNALFALALAASHTDKETRALALSVLSQVARTGTHLFMFLEYVQAFRGWGRTLKTAVSKWYTEKSIDKLAYQVVKYRNRNGWTHRDVLRKAHPKTSDAPLNAIFNWITQDVVTPEIESVPMLRGFMDVRGVEDAQTVAGLVREYNLPREAVPTEFLNSVEVWEALLDNMPMTAMVRNLGVMTANGTLKPFNACTKQVINQLRDPNAIKRSRIHPIQILFALKTYASGEGFRGNKTWEPIQSIVDALDDAYYLSFDNVEKTDKNIVIGIDTSSSMASPWREVMKPSEFAAAMAMVTIKNAENVHVTGFDHTLTHLPITAKMRLDDILRVVRFPGGGTDASLPIQWAANNGIPVDAFVMYSDGETWAGNQHVMQALEIYRRVMNRPNTKLVCVNFTATNYGPVDNNDPLCLNIVGNSPDVAQAITSFLED